MERTPSGIIGANRAVLVNALAFLIRRLLTAIPIVVCVAALVFVILRLLPADPVAMSLPPGATQAEYERARHELGFDQPIAAQFVTWTGQLLRGDFGTSTYFRRPVAGLVATALPATVELVAVGLVLGVMFGLAGGLALFARRGHADEQLLDLGSTVMMSIPEFLWALLLILLLGVALPLFPFIGRLDSGIALPPHLTGLLTLDALLTLHGAALANAAAHLVLPGLALAIGLAPLIMRVLRSSLLDTALEDYVAQARLRGVSERAVLLRHIFRNAALPTLSLIGVQGGFMFGGTVLVEVIFGYPGLGNLMVDAVRNHDLPVIQIVALVYCLLILLINALVDIASVAANPRLRAA